MHSKSTILSFLGFSVLIDEVLKLLLFSSPVLSCWLSGHIGTCHWDTQDADCWEDLTPVLGPTTRASTCCRGHISIKNIMHSTYFTANMRPRVMRGWLQHPVCNSHIITPEAVLPDLLTTALLSNSSFLELSTS